MDIHAQQAAQWKVEFWVLCVLGWTYIYILAIKNSSTKNAILSQNLGGLIWFSSPGLFNLRYAKIEKSNITMKTTLFIHYGSCCGLSRVEWRMKFETGVLHYLRWRSKRAADVRDDWRKYIGSAMFWWSLKRSCRCTENVICSEFRSFDVYYVKARWYCKGMLFQNPKRCGSMIFVVKFEKKRSSYSGFGSE